MTTLAQGDGFGGRRYEAAPSSKAAEERATFPAPTADAATTAWRRRPILEHNAHDDPDPEQPKIMSYVEVFQNRLRDYIQDSLERGATCR